MKKKNKIEIIYLLLSLSGSLLFIIILLLRNENVARWLVMQHNYNYQFSDFFRQIVYASNLKDIYFNTGDAPFPPFAYLCFNLIYKMNPVDVPIDLSSWKIIQDYQYNLLIFMMFMILVIILLVEIIKRILEKNSSFIFIVSIVLSAPFMAGAIERGNIAIVVCVLLLWAFYLKDSEILWKKELALILIAISAGLKIYPAVFGCIYLKERRWKEAGRLLIYGLIFFFVPFVFTGGIDGLRQYVDVLRNFEMVNRPRWTSIRCFLFAICNKVEYEMDIHYGIIIENIYLIVCLASMFKAKEKWKDILFCAGIMTLYVSNSYRYVSVYMLLPLIFWLSQQRNKWNDYIYCILFSFIFTIPTYAYFINGEVDFYIFAPIYLIMVFSIFETWFMDLKRCIRRVAGYG